ncbi:UDP-galactose 4-epimerase [Novosphingobium aromaticivorans DSM 12444]|uniref:UDP-glucose 4-epimerase n=2 Tax=Novosphingobium aromaticivorans TaxID=48935 RepID=Q2G7W5_NOVAD|nr:UDP-galactose 4-epimerase [Novosphingobium aromaticivorans DSM 12444]SCY60438.1 UDP-galactose 4-epimerase [Novosphingobium aromaticivorans]
MIFDGSSERRGSILVTGGAGYIGSHAVLALLDAGWPVIVLDNLTTGFRWAVDPRASFVEGDVTDSALVRSILTYHEVAAIMHFAGSVVVPESVVDPLKYYGNNTAATCSLLRNAVDCGVPHIVFSSTAATYGSPDVAQVCENTPTRPINPYGRSKLVVEAMLADAAAAYPINYCALRYFNVAGADPAGRTGQSTAGATHLIKVCVEAALGRRELVEVYGTDYDTHDGTGVRDYIHVSDLADAHVHALHLLMDDPEASHTMNCGYGTGFSVLDVLDAVERISGREIRRVMRPRRPGDPAALIADNNLILSRTRWRPRHARLGDIVRHALAWEDQLARRKPGQPVGQREIAA